MDDFFFVKLLMPTAPMFVAVGECLWIYSFIVSIFFYLGGNFELEPPTLCLSSSSTLSWKGNVFIQTVI